MNTRRMAAAALALVLGGAAHAATFNICSQNTLHLGYSSTDADKVKALKGEFTNQFAATPCNVIVLQETMRAALESGSLPQGALAKVVPTNTTYKTPYTGLLGKTSYKESYAFIVATSLPLWDNGTGKAIIYSPSATVAAKFARPPAAVLLKTGDAAKGEWTWIVNIHAIFGKTLAGRQKEAQAMNEFALELADETISGNKFNRIVIGGDWNIGADSPGFDTMKNDPTLTFKVQPNMKTSLTKNGQPSEPYDHFAWSKSVTLTNPKLLQPPNMVTWRVDVSDHMGIAAQVTHN